MTRWHSSVVVLSLWAVSCSPPDVIPWRDANQLEISRGSHVTATHMSVFLRNPGPYRLTKLRFELGHSNSDHTELQCHAVNVTAEIPPHTDVAISLPLAGQSYRCERNSSVAPSLQYQLLDLYRDRITRTQVCADTDDPSWQWSLLRAHGTREY